MADALKPGWLSRSLESAVARAALGASPTRLWQAGHTHIKAPLAPDDAAKLRKMMADRYFQWTGRALGRDLDEDGR